MSRAGIARDAFGVAQVQNRVIAAAENRTLVNGWQKAGAVRRGSGFGRTVRHHNESREILILRPNP